MKKINFKENLFTLVHLETTFTYTVSQRAGLCKNCVIWFREKSKAISKEKNHSNSTGIGFSALTTRIASKLAVYIQGV